MAVTVSLIFSSRHNGVEIIENKNGYDLVESVQFSFSEYRYAILSHKEQEGSYPR